MVLRRLPATLALLLSFAWAITANAQTDRWEHVVAAYEAADRVSPPPKGEVVFTGSSSIQRWDVAASFPELKVINRGISGSELADAVRYVDRLVIPYEPRLVVVYAGDNDINNGRTSEQVAVEFERFVAKVHAKLPQTRIVFIGLKPSILRWSQVERMRSANTMIRAFCAHDDGVAFVDVDGPMLGWDEKPRRELFVEDGLHLTADGYRLWATLLRPFLAPPVVLSSANR